MKQPTINGKQIGRYQKIELYNIIVAQQIREQQLNQIINIFQRATTINKKNLELFKAKLRAECQEPEPLEDK